ncbi:hypothetical protein QL285_009068 [Trifolium repens]|nr:hypothetical protein QL285_009068 [Trifolium repens]
MKKMEEVVEIDTLEKSLLENNDEEEAVLYAASFRETEKNFVKYQTIFVLELFILLQMLLFTRLQGRYHFHVLGFFIKRSMFYCILWLMLWLNKGTCNPFLVDDVKILGIANPNAFRKAVMMRLSNLRNEIVSRQVSTLEDASHSTMSPSKSLRYDSSDYEEQLLLQKVEEIGSSVKRMQTLLEEQQSQATKSID